MYSQGEKYIGQRVHHIYGGAHPDMTITSLIHIFVGSTQDIVFA